MKMCKENQLFITALTGTQILKALFMELLTELWGGTKPKWQGEHFTWHEQSYADIF